MASDPAAPDPRAAQRESFSRQAATYARSLLASDLSLGEMLELAEPRGDELMLDLAAGTGMVSLVFAAQVGRVVAVDLTPAMLAEAAERRAREGIGNVELVLADVVDLPFADDTFDLAACRIAIHHFPEPAPILVELRRVLRPKSRAVICDTLSSDDPTQAELHNRIERIRDPAHVRMLAESDLRALLESAGFKIEAERRTGKRRGFGEWTRLAQTPPEAAEEARRLLVESIDGDRAGIEAALEEGEVRFTHRSAIFRVVRAG